VISWRLPCLLLALAGLAGCYSWQVAAGVSDGAAGPEASRPDVGTLEVGTPSRDSTTPPIPDAQGTSDTGGHVPDSGKADATGPSCATLTQQVTTTQAAAKACTESTADECLTSVTDPCGCKSFVTQPSAAATTAYTAAVAALKASGCPIDCSTPCLSPDAVYGLCLTAAVGSGLGTECSP
jgi:hypothetical protein